MAEDSFITSYVCVQRIRIYIILYLLRGHSHPYPDHAMLCIACILFIRSIASSGYTRDKRY